MNVKFLIVALAACYLSCETSAAAIQAEGAEAEAYETGVEGGEFGAEVTEVGTEESESGTEEDAIEAEAPAVAEPAVEAEAATATAENAIAPVAECKAPITFKCGILECPNGSVCFINENPSDCGKKITKITQCKDKDGTVLAENITTEDLPDGEIPFTAVKRKTVNHGTNGNGFFGSSSYAGSFKRGNLAPFIPIHLGSVLHKNEDAENIDKNAFDIDFDDGVGSVGFLNYFDNVMNSTKNLMHNIFGSFLC